MLSVLQVIFSKPLEREELLSTIELSTIFPSLDEIIEMHCKRIRGIPECPALFFTGWWVRVCACACTCAVRRSMFGEEPSQTRARHLLSFSRV